MTYGKRKQLHTGSNDLQYRPSELLQNHAWLYLQKKSMLQEQIKIPNCVNAVCILMTVVQFSALHLSVCCTLEIVSKFLWMTNVAMSLCGIIVNHWALTIAIQSIFIQLVSCVTAAVETPNGVSTIVFTASICNVTFIDVYGYVQQQNEKKMHQLAKITQLCRTHSSQSGFGYYTFKVAN